MEENKIKIFAHIGNNIERWRESAENLAFTANTLKAIRYKNIQFPKINGKKIRYLQQTLYPELMLWGLTLENFFKCLILKNGEQLVREGKYVGPKNHNLTQMARKAKFKLSPDQKLITDRLTKVIKWSGRYPIAQDLNNTTGLRQWVIPTHDEVVESLIKSLQKTIKVNL